MKRTNVMVLAAVLLILMGGLYYFLKPEYVPPPDNNQKALSDSSANINFVGSSIVEQKDGKKIWEITAESIQIDPNTKAVNLKNIKGTFYRESGGTTVLTADRGMIDNASRDVSMEGNFKAVTSEGAVLTSDKAIWKSKLKHFYGSGNIRLTNQDAVITGDNIDSDDKMDLVTVQGNAHIIKGGELQ